MCGKQPARTAAEQSIVSELPQAKEASFVNGRYRETSPLTLSKSSVLQVMASKVARCCPGCRQGLQAEGRGKWLLLRGLATIPVCTMARQLTSQKRDPFPHWTAAPLSQAPAS